ncbi:MAG: OmpA family protein, partial [Nitrospinaceae bacterium]
MPTPDKSQVLREQIRIKESGLKKLEHLIEQKDEKFKYLLTNSKKQIEDLQIQLEDQQGEIEFHQKVAQGLIGRKDADSKTDAQAERRQEDSRKMEVDREKFRKTLDFLEKFRRSNTVLTSRLKEEQKNQDILTRQKEHLTKEVLRLRQQPKSLINEDLKKRVVELEKQLKQSQERFESLINEKDHLVLSFEDTLAEVSFIPGFPPMTLKEMKKGLLNLKDEKIELKKQLERERRKFKSKLSQELGILEQDIERNIKKRVLSRNKTAKNFAMLADEGSGGGWMTTFADMSTLLLTFFILHYSIVQMNMVKIQEAISGEKMSRSALIQLLDSTQDPQRLDVLTGLHPALVEQEVKTLAEDERFKNLLDVVAHRDKIVLRLSGGALFAPGTADLDLEATREILDELVRLAGKYREYKIRIQGHTDDSPLRSDRFPTNWELSAARATAVLRYFLDKNVDAGRLSAAGYAETFPVARNDTEPGRKKNRRV